MKASRYITGYRPHMVIVAGSVVIKSRSAVIVKPVQKLASISYRWCPLDRVPRMHYCKLFVDYGTGKNELQCILGKTNCVLTIYVTDLHDKQIINQIQDPNQAFGPQSEFSTLVSSRPQIPSFNRTFDLREPW